ncbi:helix-turn-helix domain containing protein [Clostridium sp. 2-1]|uniref:helix-turn-helix domain containing protein n=1 Tax=Clostridium TaxID=1485 RepID=UPI000CDAD871|nr:MULTISPECIES: helix-turn-helix domain containing protein [Clostridium]MBN7575425.1 DNA-binding response regulator [Clostridium beijerinckii]MBN7580736.1 DNA-binding response regulator [Clostridium beijerinckii]MBN7585189.1 DNA-binding response regulator [Clostridium beijerinckii]MBO0522005.1 DNA-binding response regulator [Clostridium beijerinckii]POO91828.1 helix-turn-helix domain containing protein [Clostridium sp. 2-1]
MKSKLEKEKVKKLYLDGLKSPEIARKLEVEKDTVKKCIQRNFSHLKHKHDIAVVQRRENIKATNYEANKYMGDSTFIKKNRSIYETKLNGDIVINKRVAPVVTWDTPKKLINEDSKELYEKRVVKKYRDTSNELLN